LQLAKQEFDCLFYSPLSRAADTAEAVWNGRAGPQYADPVLREIDLYTFQVKIDMKLEMRPMH
jgi:broad specificity phosphatase PhoE